MPGSDGRFTHKTLSGQSRTRAPAAALEKRDTEASLKNLYPPSECGLRYVKRGCGSSKASVFSNKKRISQIPEIKG